MKKKTCLLLFMICLFGSCVNSQNEKYTSHVMDSVTSLNEEQKSVSVEKRIETPPEYLFDIWGMSHAANVNVTFSSDGSFVFNDRKEGQTIVREGTFEYKDETVILHCKDSTSLVLKCECDKENDDYYLRSTDMKYYFVKGLSVPDSEE